MELPEIDSPDIEARRAAVARFDGSGYPAGGLGRLAELGCWLAAAQGVVPPKPPARPRLIVAAADHGIAATGVSVHDVGTTAARLEGIGAHSAPVSIVARVAKVSTRVVDVGLATEDRPASGRIDTEDALGADEALAAFTDGRALADEEIDSGADLLIPAAPGVGATTPAATLVAAITATEPVAVIGRGSGIDDLGWMRKATAVRDALRRARGHVRDPLALLRVAGGADLAVLTGFCVQAAVRRTPVLLDGLVVGTAALLADELAPRAREWFLVAQRSPEPAMELVCAHLDLTPLVELDVRLADGTGALAVVPMFDMAARLLAEGV